MTIQLSPSQQQTRDALIGCLRLSPVVTLRGRSGLGKSIVLQAVHQQTGGVFFQLKDFIELLRDRHPLAIEESFEQLMMQALQAHDCVIVDDFDVLLKATYHSAYPRGAFMRVPMLLLTTYAEQTGKKLILCNDHDLSQAVGITLPKFQPQDYQAFFQHYLPDAQLDHKKIYRFAANLNGYQLKVACLELQGQSIDTEEFIDYLRSRQLASNVNLQEVQAVDFSDLKGVDSVIQSLEANIILPLENDKLAQELNLKPKRGVLLAGPPGTGKTTIGRALAHRLKSKFFLIDGTFIAGSGDFYNAIHQVFEYAKQNAPSIIFIDDSDVIFESGGEFGLYRYLLTMLDGLESEGIKQVCLMMTAMNVSNLPPALVRSGRIELWLEMRLPDSEARSTILSDRLQGLPPQLATADISSLAEATEGFTGADLKRLVEDGKTLYAYDLVRQRDLRSPTDYFLEAIETVRTNKTRYAEAEAIARDQGRHQTSTAAAMFNLVEMQSYITDSGIESTEVYSE